MISIFLPSRWKVFDFGTSMIENGPSIEVIATLEPNGIALISTSKIAIMIGKRHLPFFLKSSSKRVGSAYCHIDVSICLLSILITKSKWKSSGSHDWRNQCSPSPIIKSFVGNHRFKWIPHDKSLVPYYFRSGISHAFKHHGRNTYLCMSNRHTQCLPLIRVILLSWCLDLFH